MLGSRQPSALGRGGRAAPMPDVSRGTPARRRGQAAPFTKQARDRTRHLLALALQPGRLLHASRTAPRERGQLKGESRRGGRRSRLPAWPGERDIPLLQHISNGASVSRAGQAPGRLIRRVSVCVGSHGHALRCFHASNTSPGGCMLTVWGLAGRSCPPGSWGAVPLVPRPARGGWACAVRGWGHPGVS